MMIHTFDDDHSCTDSIRSSVGKALLHSTRLPANSAMNEADGAFPGFRNALTNWLPSTKLVADRGGRLAMGN